MKIILNPKYERLRPYLMNLEEHFEREGKEIHRDRNVLRTLQVDGLTLCVKRYAQPSLRGRIAVKLYKSPKGKKAYLRPLQLRERGYESPEPVAFVKYNKGLVTTTTYFVCIHSTYRYSMAGIMDLPDEERTEVTKCFARYAAGFHKDGFLHRDFSPANILFDRVNDRYRFALIDTNSIRVGKEVNIEKGCANLSRLIGDEAFFDTLAREYAAAREADPELCRKLINAQRTR